MPGVDTNVEGRPVGRGRVQGLLFQVEPSTHLNVCRFQIERKNSSGEALPTVPVEMRSMSFSGTLNNGDWVELNDLWSPGRTLHPRKFANLTTKATFESRGVGGMFRSLYEAYPGLTRVMVTLVGLIFLGVLAGAVVFIVAGHNDSSTSGSGRSRTGRASIHMPGTTVAPGQSITLSGTGWQSGESVTFYYGPDAIGNARADGNGSFNATITMPASADGFFTDVRAEGSDGDSYDQAVSFSK
jgi:hypothetical protein